MIGLKFNAAKAGFFDRKAVIQAVDKTKLRIFKEYGRLVRKRAQKSLVYAEKAAPAGSPPHAHKTGTITRTSKSTGKTRIRSVSFLREFLFFAYDRTAESVVIGPARINSTVDPNSLAALEYGGSATIVDHGKRRRVAIKAHPFMRPAAEAERPGLPAMWQDSVRS